MFYEDRCALNTFVRPRGKHWMQIQLSHTMSAFFQLFPKCSVRLPREKSPAPSIFMSYRLRAPTTSSRKYWNLFRKARGPHCRSFSGIQSYVRWSSTCHHGNLVRFIRQKHQTAGGLVMFAEQPMNRLPVTSYVYFQLQLVFSKNSFIPVCDYV